MKTTPYTVPVLLITFNRPDCASKVFERIKQLKPRKLYVFSDAARVEKDGEAAAVSECRALFNEANIDWHCDVNRWFASSNMGCGSAVSSAINWMFKKEECGIILEDDCLPDITFFNYCAAMLQKYADNPQVMHVAGTRWNDEYDTGADNYFFSRIGHVWGWATWRRAWNLYDFHMNAWNIRKDRRMLYQQLKSCTQVQFWLENFERIAAKPADEKDTWDYQWQYTLFKNRGLATVPHTNLISNIGIVGAHASANEADSAYYNRKTSGWFAKKSDAGELVRANEHFDHYHINNYFMRANNPALRLKWYLKSWYSRLKMFSMS